MMIATRIAPPVPRLVLWLIVVTHMARCVSTLSSRRVGLIRICETGRGCRCSKPTECYDFTREKRGVCDLEVHKCMYCLHGYHLEANATSGARRTRLPRCRRSDTCELQREARGKEQEVECVDGFCVREGTATKEPCICEDGFVMKRMWDGRERCTDANECEMQNECAPLHCINVEGGHRCGCRSGYRLVQDNLGLRHCEEIDECKEVTGICPQACRNLPGTFNCTCQPGYTAIFEHGQLTCTDVDECQVDACPPMTTCYNTIGSFSCSTPLQAPQTAVGWATLTVPLVIVAIVVALVVKNRRLRQEVVRMSNEDLLEKGRGRYRLPRPSSTSAGATTTVQSATPAAADPAAAAQSIISGKQNAPR